MCIAVSVSDEPFIVKLKFEPSGRPRSDRNYYLETKFNICVVCGSNESYIRKHIVPKEYRKYVYEIIYLVKRSMFCCDENCFSMKIYKYCNLKKCF